MTNEEFSARMTMLCLLSDWKRTHKVKNKHSESSNSYVKFNYSNVKPELNCWVYYEKNKIGISSSMISKLKLETNFSNSADPRTPNDVLLKKIEKFTLKEIQNA